MDIFPSHLHILDAICLTVLYSMVIAFVGIMLEDPIERFWVFIFRQFKLLKRK